MNEIEQILRALDEKELALEIGRKHDDARLRYDVGNNPVRDFRDFERVIGEYYAYHFHACVAPGVRLPDKEARQRAKELIEEEYRREGGTIAAACDDVISGMNGGLRRILDLLCDGLKRESTTRHVESVFDKYVSPNSYDEQLEIIRQLIRHFGNNLPSCINRNRPEQHARDYKQLVRGIAEGLKIMGRAARR